jgi:hypothetical protein
VLRPVRRSRLFTASATSTSTQHCNTLNWRVSSRKARIYDGRMPDSTTLLAATCGCFSGAGCSTGTSLGVLEGTGLSITASCLAVFRSDQLRQHIFARRLLDLRACGPIFGSAGFTGCVAGSPGTATRSGGTGNSIAFTNFPAVNLRALASRGVARRGKRFQYLNRDPGHVPGSLQLRTDCTARIERRHNRSDLPAASRRAIKAGRCSCSYHLVFDVR